MRLYKQVRAIRASIRFNPNDCIDSKSCIFPPLSTYGQLHVRMLGYVGRDLIPPDDGNLERQGARAGTEKQAFC